MQARWPLGNDIVDLQQVENLNSAANPRYLKRILAPEELSFLSQAHDRHRMLWAMWAAKEAVYKSLKKLDSSLIFSHRRFLVHAHDPLGFTIDSGVAMGHVAIQGWQVPVNWEWRGGWMHCAVYNAPANNSFKLNYAIRELDDYTRDPIFLEIRRKAGSRNDASVAVRMLAISMLENLGLREIEILRPQSGPRQGPPQIWSGGEPCQGYDLSLSHDGAYVAATVCKTT